MKKLVIVFMLSVAFVLPLPKRAEAQWVVIDPANLIQSILQVLNQLSSLINEASQIAHQISQIENQIRQLSLIGDGDFSVILGFLANQSTDVAALLAQANSLSYNLATVRNQIDGTYPRGEAQWGAFDYANIHTKRQEWDDTTNEAAEITAMSQSALSRIEGRNVAINSLLAAARSADGDVRQAQINNQLTGTLAGALNDLIANQATSNRLGMVRTQAETADSEASREFMKRIRADFLEFGDPNPLGAFPIIQ